MGGRSLSNRYCVLCVLCSPPTPRCTLRDTSGSKVPPYFTPYQLITQSFYSQNGQRSVTHSCTVHTCVLVNGTIVVCLCVCVCIYVQENARNTVIKDTMREEIVPQLVETWYHIMVSVAAILWAGQCFDHCHGHISSCPVRTCTTSWNWI